MVPHLTHRLPPMRPLNPKQRGVALITALLVVSLAVVLATSLVEHLNFDIRRTENLLRTDQAQLYNKNAVEFATVLLKLDRNTQNDFDTLADIQLFNDQTAVFPVEGGSVSAILKDLHSCYNVNNLSKTGTDLPAQRVQFAALLEILGVDKNISPALTDSLIDWLDKDDISEPQGAEFDYYIGLDRPYRTANGLMASPSELRLVKGFTDEVMRKIKDEVCVIPRVNTPINVNTASSKVLESIAGLKGHGDRIVKDRDGDPKADTVEDDAPFERMTEFTSYVTNTLRVPTYNPKGLQTFSEYFLLESRTQLGTGDVKLFSIIYRDQNNATTKLIRQTSGEL